MFGFDMEDIMNGYSKQDEFIARDIIILNILVEKGIVTTDEVEERMKDLPTIIEEVNKKRKQEIHDKAEQARQRLEEYYSTNKTASCDPGFYDASCCMNSFTMYDDASIEEVDDKDA